VLTIAAVLLSTAVLPQAFARGHQRVRAWLCRWKGRIFAKYYSGQSGINPVNIKEQQL